MGKQNRALDKLNGTQKITNNAQVPRWKKEGFRTESIKIPKWVPTNPLKSNPFGTRRNPQFVFFAIQQAFHEKEIWLHADEEREVTVTITTTEILALSAPNKDVPFFDQ